MKGENKKNRGVRYFVFGDIHGHLEKLENLFAKVLPRSSKKDYFVFLGDYIDRGPNSKGVIDCLVEFSKNWTNSIFLKGNHEDMLLDYLGLGGNHSESYLRNGARATFLSYNGIKNIPASHFKFLQGLVNKHKCKDYPYIFVHAGLKPGVLLKDQEDLDLLWIRKPFLDYEDSWEESRKVIYGHTPATSGIPRIGNNKIGIDTGAAYGGPLTVIQLPGETFIQSDY